MPLLPRPSSKATDRALVVASDTTRRCRRSWSSSRRPPAIINYPVPRKAQHTAWLVTSMFVACVTAMAIIKVDQVVTAQAIVVSKRPDAWWCSRWKPPSFARSTCMQGEVGARRPGARPAGSDLRRRRSRRRLPARSPTTRPRSSACRPKCRTSPFTYTGLDPNLSLQAAIYAQRKSQYDYKLEDYKQKADSLIQTIARANSDAAGYRDRLAVAQNVEQMRKRIGEAAGRQPAEHAGGDGQPGRDGAPTWPTRRNRPPGAQQDLGCAARRARQLYPAVACGPRRQAGRGGEQADRPPASRSKKTSCAGSSSSCAPTAMPRC